MSIDKRTCSDGSVSQSTLTSSLFLVNFMVFSIVLSIAVQPYNLGANRFLYRMCMWSHSNWCSLKTYLSLHLCNVTVNFEFKMTIDYNIWV